MGLTAEVRPVWSSLGLARRDGDALVAWDVEPPEGSGSFAISFGEHPVERLVVGFTPELRRDLSGCHRTTLRSGRPLVEVIKQALSEGVAVRASVAEHGVRPRLHGQVGDASIADDADHPTG